MTIKKQPAASVIRQVVAAAVIVLGAIPATALPNAVRVALIGPAGLLIVVEHYLSDPSTGSTNTSSPPTP